MNIHNKDCCKSATLEVKNILVWDKNPRYLDCFPPNFDIDYTDDTEIIKSTIAKENDTHDDIDEKDALKSFKDLLLSFIRNGFISDNDSIFVKKINGDDRYIVLEGNRRICAIKILNDIKTNKQSTIDWFIRTFSPNFYNEINSKLLNYSYIKEIDCKSISSDDINYIKSKIYKRDQINAIGKKFWSRTTYFSHMLSEYKLSKGKTIKTKSLNYQICMIKMKKILKVILKVHVEFSNA